jgi:hypothetical protein
MIGPRTLRCAARPLLLLRRNASLSRRCVVTVTSSASSPLVSTFRKNGGGGGSGGSGTGRHRCPKVRLYIIYIYIHWKHDYGMIDTHTHNLSPLYFHQCGTFVTFRHGDFDENTLYCAACSGWFILHPPSSSPTEVSLDKWGY